MDKKKKIIISLTISLIIVLLIYFISNFKSNSEFISIPVFKSNLLQDTTVNKNDIDYIQVKKTSIKDTFLKEILNISDDKELTINRNVYAGEIVNKNIIKSNMELMKEPYQYVSLPISNDSLAICNNLKFGDKVEIFYTAKLRDVEYAIKGKERLYSNNLKDGYVTCILFENVELVAKTDSTGKEEGNNLISNITVRLSKQDAMLVSNLKNLGVIDITAK